MDKPIQTALIAYGFSGRCFHAPYLHCHPNYQLATVVERHSTESKERYPYVNVKNSFEEVLEDPSIELVIITTPNKFHYSMAEKALTAGKHVVVEKPFTATYEEAKDLVTLSKKVNRTLAVYQNRRWDGDFQTIRKLLSSNLLGPINEYIAYYNRYSNKLHPSKEWKEENIPGNGILYDLGTHLVDQVVCLFGFPKKVTADLRIQRKDSSVSDYFDIGLDYDHHKACVKAGMVVRENSLRYMIHGEKGSFIKHGVDVQEADLLDGRLPCEKNWGIEPKENWGILNTEIEGLHTIGKIETLPGNYQGFYDNLYSAIREGENLAIPSEESAGVIQVLKLAEQSHEEKRSIDFTL